MFKLSQLCTILSKVLDITVYNTKGTHEYTLLFLTVYSV